MPGPQQNKPRYGPHGFSVGSVLLADVPATTANVFPGTVQFVEDASSLRIYQDTTRGFVNLSDVRLGASGTELAVATNTITVTGSNHVVDSAAGAQTVKTISGSPALEDGWVLFLRGDGTNNVTVDETANVNLGAATRVLSSAEDVLCLLCDGTDWNEVSFAENA